MLLVVLDPLTVRPAQVALVLGHPLPYRGLSRFPWSATPVPREQLRSQLLELPSFQAQSPSDPQSFASMKICCFAHLLPEQLVRPASS